MNLGILLKEAILYRGCFEGSLPHSLLSLSCQFPLNSGCAYCVHLSLRMVDSGWRGLRHSIYEPFALFSGRLEKQLHWQPSLYGISSPSLNSRNIQQANYKLFWTQREMQEVSSASDFGCSAGCCFICFWRDCLCFLSWKAFEGPLIGHTTQTTSNGVHVSDRSKCPVSTSGLIFPWEAWLRCFERGSWN